MANITRADEWNYARPSPSGKGDRHRRWMRRGTAFCIVGTIGAEVERVSETVGNGLCAVPEGVANRTRADKTEPPPGMSFRANECESRNLPKLQILSCGGSSTNVVDSSTPLRCGRNDKMGERFLVLSVTAPSFRVRNGTQAVPYGFAEMFYLCAHCFYNVSRCPAPSSVSPSGEPASPEGSSCALAGGKTPTQGRCVGVGVRSFSFSAFPIPVCRPDRCRLRRLWRKQGSPGGRRKRPCFDSGGSRYGCPLTGRQRSCSRLPG